jgi:hypothetical protein
VPNGNPSFDLAEQEAWFAPLAQTIGELGRKHNLLLEKYYHESFSWDLRFNHPRGGHASVTVWNGGPTVAKVGATWHVDDYDRFTRSIHWRPPRDVAKEPETVRRELELEFTSILALPLGQWNQVATGYEQIWGQFSRAAFYAMARKYPDPIP